MIYKDDDERFMARCLELAGNGGGRVAPNPMVGSVAVYRGRIIGEGWHRQYGRPHAEANAVDSVADKSLLPKSVLYVNLEPCSHYGKMPPCCDMIIQHRIPRVVVGIKDPFPKVNGTGIERMRAAGIDVRVGVLEDQCRWLNRRFITFHTLKRPYIVLKWAQTTDGYMDNDRPASVPPTWTTGYPSKVLVHRMRAAAASIMVGTHTVERDNPSLTVREWYGKNPLRISIDASLRLDRGSKIFDTEAQTLLFTQKGNEHPACEQQHPAIAGIDLEHEPEEQIFEWLYTHAIQSVLVEGGRMLLDRFLQKNLWDEACVFTSPLMLSDLKGGSGKGLEAPAVSGIVMEKRMIGKDELVCYRNPSGRF